jgi:hypothetical protein
MPVKYTQVTLDKIIKALDEIGYVVRFEKGNFNSGYCILEHKKVVVINKFLDLEGRINTLLDILAGMHADKNTLSETAKKMYELALSEAANKISPGNREEEAGDNNETIA